MKKEKKKKIKYKTEDDVKKALKVTDFGSISKEKVMEFISIIPKVDKDVAISIINQFPDYSDMAKEMVKGMIHLCDNALLDAKEGRKEVIESYRIVLETLRESLKDGNITPEERADINEKMIYVAERIDEVNDKHNAHVREILTKAGKIAGLGILGLGVIILAAGAGKDDNDGGNDSE